MAMPVDAVSLQPQPSSDVRSATTLERDAGGVRLLGQVRAFVSWVGDGRVLTPTGNLRIADARALVEVLDTGDLRQESARRVASSAELPMLGLIFALAAEARLVRAIRGRLVAVKRNAGIVERSPELWERMLEAFPRVGRAVCQPGWGQSLLRDRFRQAIGAVLEELRVGDGSLLIVDACDLAWEIATACYVLDDAPERHQALWRQLSDRDVRIALDVLEDLGALAQGAEAVMLTELGSWSMSRVAGEPRPTNRLPRFNGDVRSTIASEAPT